MDGHGGSKASQFCRDNIVRLLEKQVTAPGQILSNLQISAVYRELDSEFLEHASANSLQDGSTCLLALIQQGQLSVASLGDSICTLIKSDSSFQRLSVEQTPQNLDEARRIY